jgi:hypothetical protein
MRWYNAVVSKHGQLSIRRLLVVVALLCASAALLQRSLATRGNGLISDIYFAAYAITAIGIIIPIQSTWRADDAGLIKFALAVATIAAVATAAWYVAASFVGRQGQPVFP